MTNEERKSVRIELTEDQRRQVRQAIGKDAIAVEVGSEDLDDEWVVLVRVPAASSREDGVGEPDPPVYRCRPEEESPTA